MASADKKKPSLSLEEETRLMENKLLALRIQMESERAKRKAQKNELGIYWSSSQQRPSSSSSRGQKPSILPPTDLSSAPTINKPIHGFSSQFATDSGPDIEPGDKIMYSKPRDVWINPVKQNTPQSNKTESGTGTDSMPAVDQITQPQPQIEHTTSDMQTENFTSQGNMHRTGSAPYFTTSHSNLSQNNTSNQSRSLLAGQRAAQKSSGAIPPRVSLFQRMAGEQVIQEMGRDLQMKVAIRDQKKTNKKQF
ncbi:MAG: hypothetical protein EZS28_008655 [Streblomastix strix]|uniref:Uncharacterized protein n=1 Tax=Streblomastix strix TaxID=222440 RepID=A0A5J4WM02_9EUKA|nr:MAG: hypothetical protein EZS28_008655 [Streblomastix strix]